MIFLMRFLLTPLLFCFPLLAVAQTLHTFENGEVADAQKINENFNALLEPFQGYSADNPYKNVTVDCTLNANALSEQWDSLAVYDRLEVEILGECLWEAQSTIEDRSVHFRGPQISTTECPANGGSALRMEAGRFGVRAASLYLSCIELRREAEAISIYGFANAYIALYPGFSIAEPDKLNIRIRHNSTVRTYTAIDIETLFIERSSAVQMYGKVLGVPIPLDINRLLVSTSSIFDCGNCQGGTVNDLTVRRGSVASISFPEQTLNINALLVAEGSRFVAEVPVDRECTPSVDIGTSFKDDSSSIHLNASDIYRPATDGSAVGECFPRDPIGNLWIGEPSSDWFSLGFDTATPDPYCLDQSACPSIEFFGRSDDLAPATVMQVRHTGPDFAQFGFGNLGSYDFSQYEGGQLQFDIRLITSNDNHTGFALKVFCESSCSMSETDLGLIGSGGWQTVSVPVSDLVSKGLDLTDIQVPFVIWPTGAQEGVTYRLDNVRWIAP